MKFCTVVKLTICMQTTQALENRLQEKQEQVIGYLSFKFLQHSMPLQLIVSEDIRCLVEPIKGEVS